MMATILIKTRLVLLSLLPALVILGLVVQQLLNNQQQSASLEQAMVRMDILQGVTKTSLALFDYQQGQSQTLDDLEFSVPPSWGAVAESTLQITGLEQELNDALAYVSGQKALTKEIADPLYASLHHVLSTLSSTHFHLDDDTLERQTKILLELSLLQIWTIEEARLDAPKQTGQDLAAWYRVLEHQRVSRQNLLALGNGQSNVDALVSFLSSDRYLSAMQFRDGFSASSAGNPTLGPAERSLYRSELIYRVHTLSELVSHFFVSVERNLQWQMEHKHQQFAAMLGLLAALLTLIFFLVKSIWQRVEGKLNAILGALQCLIEDEQGRSDCHVGVEGNDELSEFARRINQIIDAKQQQTKELIEAREAAVSANRAKSTFLANMSHELRTPLNGIIGMTEILTQSDMNQAQKEVLNDIDASSQSLLILLNDILDLSKIESGNLNLCLEETALRETLYQSISLFQPKVSSKNLELYLSMDENLPAKVLADEHRIQQVLTNLIGNAVKFTDKGRVSVAVEYNAETASQGILTIKVADTGIGIDKAKLATIFEPFTQEDDSITRQFGGTGLGLTICRQLLAMMGGELTATSTKGLGSCFSFTIPIKVLEGSHWSPDEIKRGLLVADSGPYVNQLVGECHVAGIELIKVKEISQARRLNTDFDVVFYFHAAGKDLQGELMALEECVSLDKVVLCQPHFATVMLNSDKMHGMLTLPFLGKRFKTCLESLGQKLRQNNVTLLSPNVHIINSAVAHYYSKNHRRILIAEDNLMNQKIASFFLDKAGYEYMVASNGQEALEAIMYSGRFDAILMDCMMPVMDGITATREIRRWENEQGSDKTLIIALTASVLEEDIQSCFDAGMDAYLPKPYKSNQLYELFDELMAS
ncbi:ATP-binding protein [Vibrio navarrensis]|uniref:ATP-binding protein n=1 Tax=Vibrio navarrensis TaxID=29495 RepID=UPI001EE9C304|nr:ATP-binding protein [Vibrio navarrensis]